MSASSETPSKKDPKGRGGKREGAGRKPAHGQAGVTSGITLPPDAWVMLDAQCAGKATRSAWILGLIEREEIRRASSKVVPTADLPVPQFGEHFALCLSFGPFRPQLVVRLVKDGLPVSTPLQAQIAA